jgi:hypothetical protein
MHLKRKQGCRVCNPKHPLHGIEPGHGRSSGFEHVLISSIQQVLPPGSAVEEQIRVPNIDPSNKRFFKADLRVDLPEACGSFVVELDGPEHYLCSQRTALKPIPKQLARDRHVEKWCIENGMSIFRVPYTFMRKPASAAAYVLQAARADHAASVARVHFLDFEKTYARINTYALENEEVALLLVGRERDSVFVGRNQVKLCS